MIRRLEIDITRPKTAPLEYVGQWVAWNKELSEIIAHGHELAQVHAAADAAGHPDAVVEKVRRPRAFIGAV